jgi:CRP/FNR family transcriptional regulator, nitrogen fixation regulation protein
MSANRAGLNISEAPWTHESARNSRSIRQALESIAAVTRYQGGQEIYPEESSVECWYRVIAGAARRCALRADGQRQIVDLLLPGDFFGFGVRDRHAFTAEAITPDTAIARYPASRIETLATSDSRAARELSGIVLDAVSRLYSLLLILGRTTAEQKVGAFLLHLQERVGNGGADRLALPVSRCDIADFLAVSVETVSRSLTGLKERGVITLSGPREVAILDRDALTDEHDPEEAPVRATAVVRCAPSQPSDLPRSRSVRVRVAPFAFGNVLSEMRRWLDGQCCEPSRFTCTREGSGAVVIRVEFTNGSEKVADAFEQQFAASPAVVSG